MPLKDMVSTQKVPQGSVTRELLGGMDENIVEYLIACALPAVNRLTQQSKINPLHTAGRGEDVAPRMNTD